MAPSVMPVEQNRTPPADGSIAADDGSRGPTPGRRAVRRTGQPTEFAREATAVRLPPSVMTPTMRTCSVRVMRRSDLTTSFVKAWEHLERTAWTQNAYQAPQFVLAELEHLLPEAQPLFLAVVTNKSSEATSTDRPWDEAVDRLVGLTIVSPTWGTRDLPLPHLEAFRSDYTALDGILLDIEYAESAAQALFDFIQSSGWHGLGFEITRVGNEQADLLQTVASRRGIEWSEQFRWERAVMSRSTVQDNYEMTAISRSRRKKLFRKQRQLMRCGRYEFRIHREPADCMQAAEDFLELEAMGWKGEERSAMTCDRDRRDFYLEMVFDFARAGRVFFTEIVLNGKVIAISCNLQSEGTAFAFKIGWNPKFASSSPGLLNAFEKTRAMNSELSELSLFDSSGQPGSYLEQLWPDRISCAKGHFLCSSVGRAAAFAIRQLRSLKRRLRPNGVLQSESTESSDTSRQQEFDA